MLYQVPAEVEGSDCGAHAAASVPAARQRASDLHRRILSYMDVAKQLYEDLMQRPNRGQPAAACN